MPRKRKFRKNGQPSGGGSEEKSFFASGQSMSGAGGTRPTVTAANPRMDPGSAGAPTALSMSPAPLLCAGPNITAVAGVDASLRSQGR